MKLKLPIWIYVVHFAQERIRNPKVRDWISLKIASLLPKRNFSENHRQHLIELVNDGYTMFSNIVDENWINTVKEELKEMDCFDPWSKEKTPFKICNAPAETHVAQIKDVKSIEKVLNLANNPKVLEIVGAYFNCKPTLDSVQAWWSLNGHDTPQEAENYHRDNDGIKFLKFFLYLTDVDNDSGPHLYVKGSHKLAIGLERRRFEDAEIVSLFGDDSIVSFTGEKGIAFLEDTYGFHKGQMPKTSIRLLMQFRYSILPTIFVNREKGIKETDNLDDYTNRYFL